MKARTHQAHTQSISQSFLERTKISLVVVVVNALVCSYANAAQTPYAEILFDVGQIKLPVPMVCHLNIVDVTTVVVVIQMTSARVVSLDPTRLMDAPDVL
tara:strand:- start:973 stop:1272 length:300 start_codon:yes stop_codon:yes gene_type:complete